MAYIASQIALLTPQMTFFTF